MSGWLKTFSAVLVAVLIGVGAFVAYQKTRDRETTGLAEWQHLAADYTARLSDNPSDYDFSEAKDILARAPSGADTYPLKEAIRRVEYQKNRMRSVWDERANAIVAEMNTLHERFQAADYSEKSSMRESMEDAIRTANNVSYNHGQADGGVPVEVVAARLVRDLNP